MTDCEPDCELDCYQCGWCGESISTENKKIIRKWMRKHKNCEKSWMKDMTIKSKVKKKKLFK